MENIYDTNLQLNTEELNSNIDNPQSKVSVSVFIKIIWYFSFIFFIPIIIHFLVANNLKKLKDEVNYIASNIDAQLNLRSNVLIKMYETIKGYVKEEKALFEKILNIRHLVKTDKNDNNKSREELSNLNNSTFIKLLTIRENYPELKINESFLELMQQSVNIERETVSERNNYNMYVTMFNEKMFSFPTNIVASSSELYTLPLFNGNETDRRDISSRF